MPLSPEDRATFLELVPALGDDVDPRAILHFARMHKDALLDELAAVPGVARVRASVLRLLPELVPERADWEPLLAGAGDALLQPPTDHPLDRLARHPLARGHAGLPTRERRARVFARSRLLHLGLSVHNNNSQ